MWYGAVLYQLMYVIPQGEILPYLVNFDVKVIFLYRGICNWVFKLSFTCNRLSRKSKIAAYYYISTIII